MEDTRNMHRGEVYYVTFYDFGNHIQKGYRPAVIISNDVHNRFSGTVVVAPISTKIKDYPTHVNIRLDSGIHGQILCEQIMTVDKKWVGDFEGRLSEGQIRELDRTLVFELQIGGKDVFDKEFKNRKNRKNYGR